MTRRKRGGKLIYILILVVAAGGFYYFRFYRKPAQGPVQNAPKQSEGVKTPEANNEPSQQEDAVKASEPAKTEEVWQLYSSATFGYEIKYPLTWGTAVQQDGAFVDLGPGKQAIGGGDAALDLECMYASGFEGAEGATAVDSTVQYGANTFTDSKNYSVVDGKKTLSYESFQINFPANYADSHSAFDNPDYYRTSCKTASIIVRKDIDSGILTEILSSFKFK